MTPSAHKAIAVVGVGAVLPDAPDAATFWSNVKNGRYSISDVPTERWNPDLYFDPDPKAPDKTYSRIGGWVREWSWEPLKWRLPIPPRVSEAMDRTQKWAIMGAREALADFGYPERPLDPDRTAVILGNAMAGDKHYMTALRIFFPEYAEELGESPSFKSLPENMKRAIVEELRAGIGERLPEINEDTMPGELSNIIAGRVANLFNFHGPNFVTDAACASAMAAMNAAVEGLIEHDYDAVLTGGIDANMSPSSFIKFCKIGALSATGTRPYGDGADGFVMGEGAAVFLLERLEDAERNGHRIYALIRGFGGSSDGKGKGITAPNPVGQKLAVERGWRNAGLHPTAATMIEGHGTSTKVGDVVEVESLNSVFEGFGLSPRSIPLGSVKSNIGHLKGAAGAAGILKAALALHERVLPPSLGSEKLNPNIDFEHSPFYVNQELRPWEVANGDLRTAGVSAFGFGGTNFHAVLEEYVPGRSGHDAEKKPTMVSVPGKASSAASAKQPLRGALMLGAESEPALVEQLNSAHRDAARGWTPAIAAPAESALNAKQRVTVDFGDAGELETKLARALKAQESGRKPAWSALGSQGIFRGRGEAGKVAFLYTGQGSQYVNMMRELAERESAVVRTLDEADRVMTPILGRPLRDFIFCPSDDKAELDRAARQLRRTEITQPAVLTVDVAMTRLLAQYGIVPDMVMGHSLGEYGALVAAGCLTFEEALEAVSARGQEMAKVSVEDNGLMAAVTAPLEEIERTLAAIDGYVVVANINSTRQAVIGGASEAMKKAMAALKEHGFQVTPLPVSHAFHTEIVAPASEPLKRMLKRLDIRTPKLPIVCNVTGDFYPMHPDNGEMIELLGRQIASPVQFVKGLETLHAAGGRVFVEVGPKRALHGFAHDVLGHHEDVLALHTNHPRVGDVRSFNVALCGLWAAGVGESAVAAEPSPPALSPREREPEAAESRTAVHGPHGLLPLSLGERAARVRGLGGEGSGRPVSLSPDRYTELGHLFADFLERGMEIYGGTKRAAAPAVTERPVVVSGAGLGLPGTERVFDDRNVARILAGEQFIDVIPMRLRQAMVERNITRLVKSADGDPRFETIDNKADVIKLAARAGALDLVEEFGYPADRLKALDVVTQLAIGAGLDALRDAGIPLVMHYRRTTKGTFLPERWGLPEALRDSTGVIFASAFPGINFFAEENERFYGDQARRQRLAELEDLRSRLGAGDSSLAAELDRRIAAARAELERDAYGFDRRFLFRLLSMGHSQFAEYIGARGPNTQINAACASTAQAVSLAEDWIRLGRCRRVVVISADDVSSDALLGWIGSGFLASGAAATDEDVEAAALPFDRRRHGMIVGMGAAAMVVESAESIAERGLAPICEVLASETKNSAFHGTRLDVEHICQVMEDLVRNAESRWGVSRTEIAPRTMFVSHETYTPARGGSAQAEIHALRQVFGEQAAEQIVITNTKGFTGHAMGTGVEDVVAIKALETGVVPPVPNFKEIDPDLGQLNLSRGGVHPVEYALRLAAGFGSQISLTLTRRVPFGDQRPMPEQLGYVHRIADPAAWQAWLDRVSGLPGAELEVEKRTLRVKDRGAPARVEERPAAAEPRPASAPSIPEPAPLAPETLTPTLSPREREPEPKADDAVADRVLEIVAEKTGYPPDMLDLDLDLEADLGIDTVKQAETFAAIREAWDIPRDDNIQLRDYPTLQHAIEFVYKNRPDLKAGGETPPPPAPETLTPALSQGRETEPETVDAVANRVLEIVAEKTGYPPDMLDLDLDLEADLGIDTVKQAETFAAIREAWDIPRDDNIQLRDYPTLQHTIEFVYKNRPDLKAAAAPAPAVPETLTPQPSDAGRPLPEGEGESEDAVAAKILEIVAEKTGYPSDMLDLDLDLEADLGIDTVKQAETFAAIREAWDIPRDDNIQLRDYPTLQHTIEFVYAKRPDLKAGGETPPPAAPEALTPALSQGERETETEASAMTAVPRRVPVPVLRPAIGVCKATGVRLEEGQRVIVLPDEGGVGKALVGRLEKRGITALVLDEAALEGSEALEARLAEWTSEGPIDGIYWLAALDDEGGLEGLDTAAWRMALERRVKFLYRTARALYERFAEPGTFLVSATRLGGLHGYGEDGATAPLGGAVTGFTKTFKRERPEALVKAVDFAPSRKTAALADRLIDETLCDPGVVEVGYRDDERWSVGLIEQPADGELLELGPNTIYLVTGAAGSIVSAIITDLAANGGHFHLLDLAPEPDPASDDLRRFASDRDGLKRDLFERLKANGERATPVKVEKLLAGLERQHAALEAVRVIEKAGGRAIYHQVNLLDGDAVGAVMRDIRRDHQRLDVLIHAAGLEISHFLPDKSPGEYDLVFDVKADGFFHVLRGLGDLPLGAVVSFSSIAGRFGNAGQADYSAANDLLCKIGASLRRSRPTTRAVTIDWTAWGGIGMATRGSIPQMMEIAGIDMLPPEAGIPIVRREIVHGGGEVVIGQRLGVLLEEWDATGGLDPEKLETEPRPMAADVKSLGLYSGLVVESTLDPKEQPFLYDHQIDGTPVLPGVMGIEAFAETARLLRPEWNVLAIEDVHFLAPFKFYRHEPRTVRVEAVLRRVGEELWADCRLIGERQLPKQDEPQRTVHFTARARLGRAPVDVVERAWPSEGDKTLDREAIYRVYFHGPAYQVVEKAWNGSTEAFGLLPSELPANHRPDDLATLMEPRLIELCFQTAGLWEIAKAGKMGLPMRVARIVRRGNGESPRGRLCAAIRPNEGGGFDAQVVDEDGRVHLELEGYATVELPGGVGEEEVEGFRAILG